MVDAHSDRHVDPETLLLLAAGQLAPEEATAVERHTEGCGACRAELALARSFVEAPDAPPPAELGTRMRARFQAELEGASAAASTSAPRAPTPTAERAVAVSPAPLRPARAVRRWLLAPGRGAAAGWFAAASIVAVGLVTWQAVQLARQPEPTGVERGTAMPAAWIPTVGMASAEVLEITWTPLAQADAYRVEVVTVAGRIVWETQTEDGSAHLGWGDLPVDGDPNQPLLVRIVATGPDGFRRESDLRQLPVSVPGAKSP